MADKLDINVLAQITDTTFGRSSTPKTATYSVKVMLQNEKQIKFSYVAVVNFVSERQMIEMKQRYSAESVSIINASVKATKESYKETTGDSLSFKEIATQDSVEIINVNFHNPKRTAYYKRQTIFEVS